MCLLRLKLTRFLSRFYQPRSSLIEQSNLSSSPSQPPRAPERKRSDGSDRHLPDENERERVIVTHLRATDIVAGLGRIPAGFYVAVEADGKTAKTSNKPAMVGEDVVEWDEEISLPSERSWAVSFKVYASFELGPMLGKGELLRQFKITVGELLNCSEQLRPIRFQVPRENEVLPSCSSLRIIAERRMCGLGESTSTLELVEPDATSQLGELTDVGHRALACYRQHQRKRDLDEAITSFERVRDMCPPEHPHRSTTLFNLATARFIRCQVNHAYLDLDLPITLYQDALQLRPSGHPDHCTTALDLSFALLMRFQRRGYEADRTEARDLLSKVLELSPADSYSYRAASLALEVAEAPSSIQAIEPGISQTDSGEPDEEELIRRIRAMQLSDWDPDLPEILFNFGALLEHRFEDNGDLDDIHEAISVLEKAVHLTHDAHPDKPARLSNLGNSLFRRFERVGDLADINKSISMCEQAVDLTHDAHPDKPARLSNLGNSLFRRFERVGDLADINKSISMCEQAVDLTPDGHPSKPAWLNNLGSSLIGRFERVGDLADMNKSISMCEQAVDLTPDGHPSKPAWLSNLGTSLFRRFERVGDLADINKSILMCEQAVDLTPDGHPSKPAQLNNLGNSLTRRFEQVGDLADINKSISMYEQAVDLTPDGHPFKPALLNNLGSSLIGRFERVGDLADMNKSILMKEQAVDLTPDGHPSKPAQLNNLGTSLFRRFERAGDLADINKSISMCEQAVDLTPDGHPIKPAQLSNLGTSLFCRFERAGDLADINKSISMCEQAVDLTPDGHPVKPTQLSNLGTSLFRRFELVGDLADINKSILMCEQAVDLTPDGHPSKPAWLNNLGISLIRRFERAGDLADINKSISTCEQAVDLTPDGHPIKPAWLSSLGTSLSRRFERVGDLADINKSISMFEKAVHLTPDGHPIKPVQLNNLGNSLFRRFERVGDLADINKSILMFEQAVDLTPDGHPDKPAQLNNLGNSLSNRFERVGDLADINKSILMQERAVDLAPDGHPDKPAWLNNLGSSFYNSFQRSHNPVHLTAATTHFSAAARSLTGSTFIRFSASRSWISSSRLQGNSQVLLDAYTTSIDLLPQLAWLGLPLVERHRVLLDAADLARDAAAAAVEAGHLDMAVEWLEQGRSVVWNQFLQLRTLADELRVEHPDLADQFERISRELEQAGSRQSPTSQQLTGHSGPDTLSLEKETHRRHELASTREKLLDQIRALPGFDRFLLPKTIKQLTPFAHSGPIVYLNASEKFERCDALIIMENLGNVLHVPLPGISCLSAKALQKLFHLLLAQNHSLSPSEEDLTLQGLIDSLSTRDGIAPNDRAVKTTPQRTEGYTPNDWCAFVLAYLWGNVVNPVLNAMGFSTPPENGKKLPRIFWCPTGPFAFLPIHAAGLYGSARPGTKLSDFVISSYIPALSSLTQSYQKVPKPPSTKSNIRLVAVPQPSSDGMTRLGLVPQEINHIRTLSATSPFVTFQESCGTVEDVLTKMEASKSDWVHFACHGVQDSDNPLDSGLCLADHRRLKLSDIIRLSRPRSGLAFLSACQTAQGDEKLSEESVHLAAGMLLAGYNGVIATMWTIMDNDAPEVAKDVYQHLFRDGKVPDSTEAAEALHYAVQNLRDSGASFFSWVPFIHVGL